MAESNMTSGGGWQKVRREYRVSRFAPVITIRRGGELAISADFVRLADIGECGRVSLFLSDDGFRLGLKFHNDAKDDDAFTMSRDGGGRQSGTGRLVTAGSLVRQSATINALLREARSQRRYEPQKGRDGIWVIHLAPCFERSASDPAEIERDATGIYRYRFGADVVYIGRGKICERARVFERREWTVSQIEYSILNDEDAERRWESHWLNDYRDRKGAWPIYNQIGGIKEKRAS